MRQHGEDIRELKAEIREMKRILERKADRADLDALERRVVVAEQRLGITPAPDSAKV